MTDENKAQEPTQDNPSCHSEGAPATEESGEGQDAAAPSESSTPEADEIARVTAELQAALAAAQEQARAQVARISELEANYLAKSNEADHLRTTQEEAQKALGVSGAEVQAKEADIEAMKAQAKEMREEYGKAIAVLVEMQRAANPDIPTELITGSTMSEVTESVARAKDLVKKIRELAQEKANQEAEAARVPAGAPGRQPPSVDGLSPREKIALGVKKKG
ncbi:MAG: hypothetical protein AB1597_02275 [Chloroflexota bacterium]